MDPPSFTRGEEFEEMDLSGRAAAVEPATPPPPSPTAQIRNALSILKMYEANLAAVMTVEDQALFSRLVRPAPYSMPSPLLLMAVILAIGGIVYAMQRPGCAYRGTGDSAIKRLVGYASRPR